MSFWHARWGMQEVWGLTLGPAGALPDVLPHGHDLIVANGLLEAVHCPSLQGLAGHLLAGSCCHHCRAETLSNTRSVRSGGERG